MASGDTISMVLDYIRENANVIRDPANLYEGNDYWLRMLCAQNNMMLRVLVEIARKNYLETSILETLQEMSGTLGMIDSGVAELIENSAKR